MLALALWLTCACPEPISLDGLTVERARPLHRTPVSASFLVAKPSFMQRGRTFLGAGARDDGAERVALLKGNRFDIPEGNRVTVVGVLRVLDHPPAFVNRQFVPAWVEIRVEE